MSQQKSIGKPGAKQRDPDFSAAEAAMKRAAHKARSRAREAGGCVVIWKDGRLVEECLEGPKGTLRTGSWE